MVVVERSAPPRPAASMRSRRLLGGGTDGNEVMTGTTGALLVLLLAAIGVTIIRIGALLWLHLFLGVLLIGPLALKLASTGYRFTRYYTSNQRYRKAGPPPLALRLIAPVVVLSTLVVFGSGIGLLFAGPSSRNSLLPIHKVSFIVWIAFTAVHVLAHLPTALHALQVDYGSRRVAGEWSGAGNGRSGRIFSLAAAVTLGVVLAILAIPEFGAWLQAHRFHH